MEQRSHGASDGSVDPGQVQAQDSPAQGAFTDAVAAVPASSWLPLERLARVELSSGDAPSEFAASVLSQGSERTWRPKVPGQQSFRLFFDVPQFIAKVRVVFAEEEIERTQEFALRWLPKDARHYREIVRQQYVFSPGGSTREVEEYQVELRNLVAIELCVTPDMSGRTAFASLSRWELAGSEPVLRS